jgi:hypothetical protein
MEANGRLGKEAQKLLIALSCAIVRMENKHPEGTDAFGFAAGKEKHFWMRRLSVALQKGNAMTFDVYCEWRNTRDLRHLVSVRAREVSDVRLPCECCKAVLT